MPQRLRPGARRDVAAVLRKQHPNQPQVQFDHRCQCPAQHDQCARAVIGHRVFQLDLPVTHPRVHDLQRRHHALGRRQDIGHGNARAWQVLGQHERDLALAARRQQCVGGDRLAGRHDHVVKEVAVVRLIHPQQFLHRLAAQADLLADHLAPVGQALFHDRQLDAVGVRGREIGKARRQRVHRRAGGRGLQQLTG